MARFPEATLFTFSYLHQQQQQQHGCRRRRVETPSQQKEKKNCPMSTREKEQRAPSYKCALTRARR